MGGWVRRYLQLLHKALKRVVRNPDGELALPGKWTIIVSCVSLKSSQWTAELIYIGSTENMTQILMTRQGWKPLMQIICNMHIYLSEDLSTSNRNVLIPNIQGWSHDHWDSHGLCEANLQIHVKRTVVC